MYAQLKASGELSTENSHIIINTELVVNFQAHNHTFKLVFQGWTVQLFWVQMMLSAWIRPYVIVITLIYIIGVIMKFSCEFSEESLLVECKHSNIWRKI